MPDSPRLSRRSAVGLLGAGLAAVAAAGCDPGEDIAPSGASSAATPSGSAPADPTPSTAPDADAALVTAVVQQLEQACGALVVARRFPTLRAPLASLLQAHRGHVEALGEHVGGWTAPTYAGPAAALAGVRQGEEQLRTALVDAAGRAQSGALARLLASASASVSQHLQTLPQVAR